MSSKKQIEKPVQTLAERLRQRTEQVKKRKKTERTKPVHGMGGEQLVLLLDTSSSMMGKCEICANTKLMGITDPMTKIRALKNAVNTLLNIIDSRAERITHLQAVEFDSTVRVVSPRNAAAGAQGCTEMVRGMRRAFGLLRDAVGFKVGRVIMMSDGKPVGAGGGPDTVLDMAWQFAEHKFVIDTVAFGADADVELLREVAEITGGIMYEASSVEDLAESFRKLDTVVRGLLQSGSTMNLGPGNAENT